MAKIKIQYYKSVICANETQKRTVRAMGFSKLNQVREIEDTPAVRGMLEKVSHLVKIVE